MMLVFHFLQLFVSVRLVNSFVPRHQHQHLYYSRPSSSSSLLLRAATDNTNSAETTTETTSGTTKTPGSADLDWKELGFEFRPTNSHIEITYKNGQWGTPELKDEPYLQLHIGSTALHYGQACFEGLKAFCHQDNNVYVFRPDENAQRLQASCERILMPPLPPELFRQAVNTVVKDNIEYVPPYGSNGALYIRPLLFGSGPRIGLQPSDEYTFVILVIPVGDYYKGGLTKPVDACLITDFDRAAPRGVGAAKVAGNYAADLLPNAQAKEMGFPIGLYLDAQTQTLVEEFSTSNFVGITKDNKYVTPKSPSVLASITNKSLMQIAKDQGLVVEQREIPEHELADLNEVLAVGTAVVLTPVGTVTKLSNNKRYQFGTPGEIGPVTRQLYETMRAIQNGQVEDVHGWNHKVC